MATFKQEDEKDLSIIGYQVTRYSKPLISVFGWSFFFWNKTTDGGFINHSEAERLAASNNASLRVEVRPVFQLPG